jgi:hypothetical protein
LKDFMRRVFLDPGVIEALADRGRAVAVEFTPT